MKSNSDALRRRWQDPVYRAKQTESNRRTNKQRKAYFADPLARKQHGQAVRIGHRIATRGRR